MTLCCPRTFSVAFGTIAITLLLEVISSLNHILLTILCAPLLCFNKIKSTSFMISLFISTDSYHFLFLFPENCVLLLWYFL